MDRASLQAAVDRLVGLIEADPNKARLDRLVTRWLKRHLQRLGVKVNVEQLHSLVEDQAMLAENLENWAKREREEGRRQGREEGEEIGVKKGRLETARNLLRLGVLSDQQIGQVTGLSLAEVAALRVADTH